MSASSDPGYNVDKCNTRAYRGRRRRNRSSFIRLRRPPVGRQGAQGFLPSMFEESQEQFRAARRKTMLSNHLVGSFFVKKRQYGFRRQGADRGSAKPSWVSRHDAGATRGSSGGGGDRVFKIGEW